jgi:hypothetical protein
MRSNSSIQGCTDTTVRTSNFEIGKEVDGNSKGKVIVKVTLEHATKAQRGSRSMIGWVVDATPRPLYPRERPGTRCIGGWVGPRASLGGPARNESLYRLRYRGPDGSGHSLIYGTPLTFG